MLNSIYKPKEFAQLIGISVITLQRWDRTGKLKAYRTPTKREFKKSSKISETIHECKRSHS